MVQQFVSVFVVTATNNESFKILCPLYLKCYLNRRANSCYFNHSLLFTVLVVINVVILDQRTVDAQEGFMFNEAMPGRPSFGVHEEEEESKPFKDRILEFGNL